MRIINSENLPDLPENVKELVADGVYALFSVDYGREEYAVVIGKDSTAYLLDRTGEVVEVVSGQAFSELRLREPITFANLNNRSVRVNAA